MKHVFRISKDSQTPIHTQLAEQIHLAIHAGKLLPGERLPTVRALAVELGLNANTVARVYRDLRELGFLVLERGAGTFVALEPPEETLARVDLQKVRKKARTLIRLSKKLGLSHGELTALLDNLWKETEEDERYE